MQYTIYQVIAFLNQPKNKDRKFVRVNDGKFIIFKGNYGDLYGHLMYELNNIVRPLPIFNYIQDYWILEDNE